MMRRQLRLFPLFLLLFGLPLLAQQAPNNALGFQPGKSFAMGDYDSVNLFNGNLTAALPVGPSFTPGGNLTYGLHLVYNGNAWDIVTKPPNPAEAIPNRFSNAGLGWRLTLGDLVAPMDPAIHDIASDGTWIYASADGSEHVFYVTLHNEEDSKPAYAGSDSLNLDTTVGYTRDGSYLRLRRGTRFLTTPQPHPCVDFGFCDDYTIVYSIEAPDGNVHTFQAQITKRVGESPTAKDDAKLTYRLVSITDRFGNYLHITYSADGLTWTLKDGTPAGDLRTHTLHFLNETFYEYAGQSNAHLFISSIDFAAFNGQTATYQFHYGDYETISKNCFDQYTGVTTKTRFLNSVTQPDGSTFSMSYNKIELDPSTSSPRCSQAAGHMLQLALPTGGKIQYTLGQRGFPLTPDELDQVTVPPGQTLVGVGWANSSTEVATRTLVDAGNATIGTWTYQADLTNFIDYHSVQSITFSTPRGLAVTVKDPLQRTSVYYFNIDHIGTDPVCYPGPAALAGAPEYAMPFTRMAGTATSDGLLLSSEVYDTPCTIHIPAAGSGCTRSCLDGNSNPVQPIRSTYVQYEQDIGLDNLVGDHNRRIRKGRTIFDDDTGCGGAPCYQETDFDDFDGLGHYRTETQQSNFPGTSARVTTTHFNARGGSYTPSSGSNPDNYMILSTSFWLPGVFDYQTTAENGQTARSELCFNATTAFLERRRTMRNSDRTLDLLATFEQTNGSVTAESYFGGDSQPLSGGFATCTSNPGTPTYRLTHHYTAGSVDTSQYDGASFKSLDMTIDTNTGLASASRDTSGLLTTTYAYDTMQRLTEVHPPSDAWTKYTYAFGTPNSLSILRRPFGSSSSAPAETSSYLYFDSFGRSVLSKDQFPEGWSTTKTAYDALGRVVSTWMPELRSNSSWEDFTPAHFTGTTYDRFDRPLTIMMADGRTTNFSYSGSRVTNRTACSSASQTLAPCPAGEYPFTTTETVDGHGRLATVTEPLASSVITTYGYDVGNRLATVSTNAPEGLQQRFFTYDLAGLLSSEQHPEKGVNGHGTVSYPEYDARGHLRHKIDGTTGGAFDTTFTYDAAERLTNAQDIDPSTSNRRDVKVFTYGTDNPSGNPRLGKLQTATRHNYQPSLGGDIPVSETYTYGGPNGRVSARGTTVGGAFPANTFTLGQTWDDLGNMASMTYPSNAALAATPARTVNYTYTNALLTGIDGYTTSLTHLANGLVSHLAHANGETEEWTADPNGMARPGSIHITGTDGSDKLIGPYSYDASGNIEQIGDTAGTHTNYQYDGAGRLTQSHAFTPPSLSTNQTFSYDSFGNKLTLEPTQPHQFDPNGDGVIDPSDIFYLVNYLFSQGPAPRGADGLLSGDSNGDGLVDPSDLFFLIFYLFSGGPAPSLPLEALPNGEDTRINPGAADSVTVGTVNANGNTVDVPVYIRDLSGSPLGRDQAPGSKIQSFSIKVNYAPASSVSSVTFTRSGITAGLSPAAEFNPSSTHSISLVETFPESTNILPFTLNAALPGDLVGHLVFTLNTAAIPGSTIALSLDPSVTLLSNAAGTTKETPAAGTLALVDGAINIPAQLLAVPPATVAAHGLKPASTSFTEALSNAPSLYASAVVTPSSPAGTRSVNRATGGFKLVPTSTSYSGTTNHNASFVYDEAGDVLHDDQGRAFTYDALNMTTGASLPLTGGGTRNFTYIYTADDERIALVEKLPSGDTTTRWTLRGTDNHLLRTWLDKTSADTHTWTWSEDEIWRGGSLLAYQSPTGVRHIGLDHLGSTVFLTDSNGHLIGNVSYDAFGSGGATGAGMLQYTGHERDAATVGPQAGTARLPDYLHARYYDSNVGRFLSLDPVLGDSSTPQTWNRYTYVSNNPINGTDPTGRCTQIEGEDPCSDGEITVGARNPSDEEYFLFLLNETEELDLPFMGDWSSAHLFPNELWSSYQTKQQEKLAGHPVTPGAGVVLIGMALVGGLPEAPVPTDEAGSASSPTRIYSARELVRRAEDTGPNHNFPESYNESIFHGTRTVFSDTYVQYTQRGTLNGETGTYEIGVTPAAGGRVELIVHRFFRPDSH